MRRRAERQTGLRAEVLALARAAGPGGARADRGDRGGRPTPRAVLDALSGLAAAGLVRLGEQGWATAHDLVAETVTAALAPGERGRLHGLLARALEAEDADPSEIARHHRAAGDVGPRPRAFLRAAGTGAGRARDRARRPRSPTAGLALATAGLRPPARRAGGGAGRARRPRPPRPTCARRSPRPAPRARAFPAPGPARDADVRARRTSARASELAELALVEAGDDAGGARRRAGDRRDHRHEHRPRRPRRANGPRPRSAPTAGSATPRASRGSSTAGRWRRSSTGGSRGRSPGSAGSRQLFDDSGELLRAVTPRSTRGHGLVFAGRARRGAGRDHRGACAWPATWTPPRGRRTRCGTGPRRCPRWAGPTEAEADAREALRPPPGTGAGRRPDIREDPNSAKGLYRLGAASLLPWLPAFPMKPCMGSWLGSEWHDTGAVGFKLAAPCATANSRWSWVAVAPLDYASLECLCVRLRSRQSAIEFGDPRPLVEENLPVLSRPSIIHGPQQRHDLGLVARQRLDHGGRRRRWCLQYQVVAIDLELDADGACHAECLNRAHTMRFFHKEASGGAPCDVLSELIPWSPTGEGGGAISPGSTAQPCNPSVLVN